MLDIKTAPQEIQDAFKNVQIFFPEVVSVTYESTEDFHGWTYLDAEGKAPNFDDYGVNVDLLEKALDVVEDFPVTYLTTN